FLVPRKESSIEKRQMKLRIVLFDSLAFIDRSPCAADAESQVPHGAGKFRYERPEFLLGFFVFKQKQYVQIREGEQHPPAIPSECQKRQAFVRRFVYFHYVAEDQPDSVVRKLAQSA